MVPFVAKILEACAKSKVFRSPNPWLMATMMVMAELHAMTDLKLNLKFEVEVLCNTLNMDLKVSMVIKLGAFFLFFFLFLEQKAKSRKQKWQKCLSHYNNSKFMTKTILMYSD